MAQYVNETAVVGSSGYKYSGKLDGVIGNVALKETAGTACTFTIHGPDGDTILAVAANGQRFRRNVRIDYFTIVGNGATLLVDISGPQEYRGTELPHGDGVRNRHRHRHGRRGEYGRDRERLRSPPRRADSEGHQRRNPDGD